MSGHGGFSVIGNGLRPPQVGDVPQVGDLKLEGRKAEGVKIEKVEAPAENARLAQANRVAVKLDALLLNAAKSASSRVDVKALKTTLSSAKLDKATRNAIVNAAKRADTAFKAIDNFTGRTIAAAMTKGGDGLFAWDENNPAGAAIKAALDAQEELSDLLIKAINTLPADAPAAAQSALEEAMLRTDHRASEIQMLVCEFADIAEMAGDDPQVAARLDRTLESLIPSQSLKMHGNDKLAADFHKSLQPLAKKIDDLAMRNERQLSGAEEAKIRRQIDEAFNALATAAQSYAAKGVQIDKALMESAKGMLVGFNNTLTEIRRKAVFATLRNFADKTFGVPDIPVFKPKFAPIMRGVCPTLLKTIEAMRSLRAAADVFFAKPSDATFARVRAAAMNLSFVDDKALAADLGRLDSGDLGDGVLYFNFIYPGNPALDTFIASRPSKERAACTDALKAEFRTALEAFLTDKTKTMATFRTLFGSLNGISTQVDHLASMYRNAGKIDKGAFLTNKTLMSAFEGDVKFSTLVETRLCGLPDEDANPALDDANTVSTKKLGSGGVNTVYEVGYKDGSSYVFKPEAPGRQAMENLNLAHEGYKSFQMVAHLNMASQKTADAFGLGDVMAKTSVGSHEGQFGIFMEKAPGKEASFFKHEETGNDPNALDAAGIKALDDDKYEQVVGDIMRQTNRLEWADILTAQGDRHSGNYLMGVSADGQVMLKGIDNDACFSSYAIGLRKYKLTGSHARHFEQLLNDMATKLYPGDVKRAQAKRINDDPGVSWEPDGSIVVNAALVKLPEIHACLQMSLGLQTDFLPTVMDEDLYAHLMEMKSGNARDTYIADLRARLPEAAVEAAVRRLDDVIAYADALKTKGRILSVDQWRSHNIQRIVAGKMPLKDGPAPLPQVKGMDPVPGKLSNEVTKSAHAISNNLFRRDFMAHIAKPGWFDE